MYEALGRFVVRFRWAIVVFWLAGRDRDHRRAAVDRQRDQRQQQRLPEELRAEHPRGRHGLADPGPGCQRHVKSIRWWPCRTAGA